MADACRRSRSAAAFVLAALLGWARPGSARGARCDGADFLRVPVGGRPAALGGAYSALASDAYAPVWNPAGLALLPDTQVAGMHVEYAQAIGYESVSGAVPLSAHDGLGAAVQYLHPKSATARDATGTDVGTFSSYYAAYTLAYGRGIGERLALGGAVKVVDARIADVSGRAVAGDVGGLYRVSRRVAVAAAAVNLGGRLRFLNEARSLPDGYRLGLLLTPTGAVSLAAEGVYDRADAAYGRFGAEWRPAPALALRAGYHSEATRGVPGLTGLTTGVGLTALGQRFDYAWAPMGLLGDTQYFSVLLTFGGPARKENVTPPR